MKKLFYMLLLIGLVGCSQQGTILPDNLKEYKIYEYDNSYGMYEKVPFDGLHGKVKQIVYHTENGGTETYTFHKNGMINEITTDQFDDTSLKNKVDKTKFIYKYNNGVLSRTILKNGSKIHTDKTYYREGLPLARESKAGKEKWEYDNQGRLVAYYRNEELLMDKKYMLESAYEGKWIEENNYKLSLYFVTHYDADDRVIRVDYYNGVTKEFSYSNKYEYYENGYTDGYSYYDKYGNLEGDRHHTIQYEFDGAGNWTKRITDFWHSENHSEEIRKIIYWE